MHIIIIHKYKKKELTCLKKKEIKTNKYVNLVTLYHLKSCHYTDKSILAYMIINNIKSHLTCYCLHEYTFLCQTKIVLFKVILLLFFCCFCIFSMNSGGLHQVRVMQNSTQSFCDSRVFFYLGYTILINIFHVLTHFDRSCHMSIQ